MGASKRLPSSETISNPPTGHGSGRHERSLSPGSDLEAVEHLSSVAGAREVSAQNRTTHCLPVTGFSLYAGCQGEWQLGVRAHSMEDTFCGSADMAATPLSFPRPWRVNGASQPPSLSRSQPPIFTSLRKLIDLMGT